MKNSEDRAYSDCLASGATCEKSCEEHMLEVQRSQVLREFRKWLTTWPTCKMLGQAIAKMLSTFLYPHYKSPHYPRNYKESFREKTLEII